MGWNVAVDTDCTIARTLAVIGDRWTMLIIREIFLRTRRFDEFLAYTGMSSSLLTQRLNLLLKHGVLRREPYCERPTRYEYRLTAKGMDLYPIVIALKQWGDRWSARGRRSLPRLKHKDCGKVMSPLVALTCSACGRSLGARDVIVAKRPPPIPSQAESAKMRRRRQ